MCQSQHSGPTSTFYTFDPSGNLAVVLNSSSAVLGDELFEANGRRDGSYSARPVDFGGQWGYYGDAETALTLLGHRYYDAYAGRFLTRDPISYNGGINLYSYTANDYENWIDPEGYAEATLKINIWNGVAEAIKQGGKYAAAEEVAGGGPENPAADYLALLTTLIAPANQIGQNLANIYITPQDSLAAPVLQARSNNVPRRKVGPPRPGAPNGQPRRRFIKCPTRSAAEESARRAGNGPPEHDPGKYNKGKWEPGHYHATRPDGRGGYVRVPDGDHWQYPPF